MTKSVLLSTHLTNLLDQAGMSAQMLSDHLGYKHPLVVRGWLQGTGRPSLGQLKPIAEYLKADLVELMMVWMVDQAPELEEVAWTEVLGPRGSHLPRSSATNPERPASSGT